MSFWEALTLVGTTATIFGIFLAIYALINNKTLKEESRLTREFLAEILDRMDKRAEERHRELLSKS